MRRLDSSAVICVDRDEHLELVEIPVGAIDVERVCRPVTDGYLCGKEAQVSCMKCLHLSTPV